MDFFCTEAGVQKSARHKYEHINIFSFYNQTLYLELYDSNVILCPVPSQLPTDTEFEKELANYLAYYLKILLKTQHRPDDLELAMFTYQAWKTYQSKINKPSSINNQIEKKEIYIFYTPFQHLENIKYSKTTSFPFFKDYIKIINCPHTTNVLLILDDQDYPMDDSYIQGLLGRTLILDALYQFNPIKHTSNMYYYWNISNRFGVHEQRSLFDPTDYHPGLRLAQTICHYTDPFHNEYEYCTGAHSIAHANGKSQSKITKFKQTLKKRFNV